MTTITGTSANDILTGTAGDDSLFGLGGDDILFGGDGFDFLFGGDGYDRLFAGDGGAVMYGGAGPDAHHLGAGPDVVVLTLDPSSIDGIYNFDPAHNDRIDVDTTDPFTWESISQQGSTVVIEITQGGQTTEVHMLRAHLGDLAVQNFTGGTKSQGFLDAIANAPAPNTLDNGDNYFEGDATGADTFLLGGNDVAYGNDGDDRLFGGDGDDVLHGNAGENSLFGGDGNDRMFAGAEGDTLDGGQGDDAHHLGAGADTIILRSSDDGSDQISGVYNFESDDIVQFIDPAVGTWTGITDTGSRVIAELTVQQTTHDVHFIGRGIEDLSLAQFTGAGISSDFSDAFV